MLKTLLREVKQYKKATLLAPLFVIGEVFMEVLIPFIIAMIIDKGIEAGNIQNVYRYGALMIVMAFLSLAFGTLSGRYAAVASAGFACNLRDAMYQNIQTFSFSNIDKYSTAGLVTRMTTDVTNVQNAFQMCIRIAVRSPVLMISSMIMCLYINPKLSLIFVAAMIFLAFVLFSIIRVTTKIFNRVFDQYDYLNASVQENVSSIRVVKSFVREDYETDRFYKEADKLYNLSVKAESLLAFNNPSMMLAVYFCIIALAWFGAQFVVVGDLTTGQLTSMFSYVMSIMMGLMMLSMIFVMITMSLASGRRIAQVLNEKADLTNPENPITEVPDGSIRFEHVNFAYAKDSDEYTLTDLNFEIKSGETIGIIGGTGSGKSSLVNLISRLYDVTDGAIYVGGHDVRDYDMEQLRNQVSVVLQKNVLFSGTILENLRWGNENATEEECIEACRQACADEFISQFPDGYNTRIEQGGTNVSGGQKQRLCIARALLKKPKILILDDSTSAVDTATDAKIRQAFAETIPGTTKLIIAQRVASVEDADRILVLDGGRVISFDTHENLMRENPIYQEIYEAQTSTGDFDHETEG